MERCLCGDRGGGRLGEACPRAQSIQQCLLCGRQAIEAVQQILRCKPKIAGRREQGGLELSGRKAGIGAARAFESMEPAKKSLLIGVQVLNFEIAPGTMAMQQRVGALRQRSQ